MIGIIRMIKLKKKLKNVLHRKYVIVQKILKMNINKERQSLKKAKSWENIRQ